MSCPLQLSRLVLTNQIGPLCWACTPAPKPKALWECSRMPTHRAGLRNTFSSLWFLSHSGRIQQRLYMCPITHGLPPSSLCSLQKRRHHSRNVEFLCSNAELTMQDSFQWMDWPQGRSARWAMTADAVAVQTEADIKASNTQAKRIKLCACR